MLLALSALVSVAAIAALILARGDTEQPVRRSGAVALVGDSLNVGIEPYLADELKGWRITTDDVVGRSTDDGIAAVEAARSALAPIVVVSLGTNDPQGDVDGFSADVRSLLQAAGNARCVVWSTVWREGANEAFNRVLRAEAEANRNLLLVEWDVMVAESPELLVGDGVHATPEGYERRAQVTAEVVRRCPIGSTAEAGR